MKKVLSLVLILPMLGAVSPEPSADQACVDVRIGNARSYDCINRMLQSLAVSAHGVVFAAPSAATEATNRTGQATESATRERLGDAFGHSVTPQRPTATFAAPPR